MENYQIICKNRAYFYDENIIDISSFKNGSFCLLYSDKIEYYSSKYEFLYDISLDYNPTHLLTFAIKSELYVVVRNRKSLYLYIFEYDFVYYMTKIDLNEDITYWTKSKDNKIVICSKNRISFYEIEDDDFLKTRNDIIINEETLIENSPYYKTNEEIKEKIKEKESNSKNLLILKLFELENDYIIVIKKELYEEKKGITIGDCPQCSTYILKQTNLILLSIIKLNKKEKIIKNIYEIEITNKFKNEYYGEEYYDVFRGKKERENPLYYFDNNIIDSIEILENKVLFYNPELKNIEIIDINSSFEQKYKSVLYNPEQNLESYKIIFLSEKCFYIFKCRYEFERDSEYVNKTLDLINNNEYDDCPYYDIVFIKKINSLLFIFDQFSLTISKKII